MAGRFLRRVVGLSATCLAVAVAASPGSGAAVFLEGGTDPEARVLLGDPAIEAPARLFACANCHGRDGRGGSEAGVRAPDITWERLTKPYAVKGAGGRERSPYNRERLQRALRDGLNPDGRPLASSMPRYRLSQADLDGLVKYLGRLEAPAAPGVTGREIRIWVWLPPRDRESDQGHPLQMVVQAYFDDLNRLGGIFQRKIRPVFARAVQTDSVFAALVLNTSPDAALPQPAPELPVIALFPSASGTATVENRFVLYAGAEAGSTALLRFALDRLGLEAEQVLWVTGKPEAGRPPTVAVAAPNQRQLRRKHLETEARAWVVDGGGEALAAALAVSLGGHQVPTLLVDGWPADPDLGGALLDHPGPVYLALRPTAGLATEAGRREYARLAAGAPLPRERLTQQLWALSATKLLVSALQTAGRRLDRAGLIHRLEGFRGLQTSWGPPLSFGPNRRLGANGATVIRIDGPGSRGSAADRPVWISLAD